MKHLALTLALILLTGCANTIDAGKGTGPIVWTKEGVTAKQARIDWGGCKRESAQHVGLGQAMAERQKHGEMQDACMEEKGYEAVHLSTVPPGQGSIPR